MKRVVFISALLITAVPARAQTTDTNGNSPGPSARTWPR
jgi:hypothetical protein